MGKLINEWQQAFHAWAIVAFDDRIFQNEADLFDAIFWEAVLGQGETVYLTAQCAKDRVYEITGEQMPLVIIGDYSFL